MSDLAIGGGWWLKVFEDGGERELVNDDGRDEANDKCNNSRG